MNVINSLVRVRNITSLVFLFAGSAAGVVEKGTLCRRSGCNKVD